MVFAVSKDTKICSSPSVLFLPTAVHSIGDGGFLYYHVASLTVLFCHSLYLWLFRSCSVGLQFFRRNRCVNRCNLVCSVEEVSSGSCYIAIFMGTPPYNSHSNRFEVISHCSFDLHFPDDYWRWTSFYEPIGHLHVFGKISIQLLWPFFSWILLLLLS